MHKIKPGTHTTETVKSNFKGTIESFVARDNEFSYDVLAMAKQLAISTYFKTLSCADLR